MNVIAQEFNRRCEKASKALQAETNATQEDDVVDVEAPAVDETSIAKGKVPMGKHYMVFMATTWSSEGRPFAFVAARYCLFSLSGRWIRFNKRQITSSLALYGFIVNANSFDGTCHSSKPGWN